MVNTKVARIIYAGSSRYIYIYIYMQYYFIIQQ